MTRSPSRTLLISLVVSLALVTAAVAAVSPELAAFGNGPARHLMTKAEQKQWNRTSTDQEAQVFIDLFWARRDPTPDTAANEYRDEFDRRVRGADARFTTKNVRGALSDRGRILILLGPPTQSLDQREGAAIEGSAVMGRKNGRTQTWIYRGKELPPGTKFPQIEINFWDANSKGEYVLSVGGGTAGGPMGVGETPSGGSFARALAFDAIGSARDRAIVSPDLKEPRKFAAEQVRPATVDQVVVTTATAPPDAAARDTSLKSASLRSVIEKARNSGVAEGVAKAILTWRQFEPQADKNRTGIHLLLPAGSGAAAGAPITIFGEIVDDAGKIAGSFEQDVAVRESIGDLFVDRAVVLAVGHYSAVVGAAKNGTAIALGKAEIMVRGDDGKGSVRELVLSNNLQPLRYDQLDEAFAVGSMKVIPKANRVFRTDDRLWYVFQVRNPARAEAGALKIKVAVIIRGTGDSNAGFVRRTAEKEVMANQLTDDGKMYWVGNSIPLSSFAPGKYEILIMVTDAIANEKYEMKDSFSVTGS